MDTKTIRFPLLRVFVFRGEACLGWDCFCKHSIQIGSHPESDVFLDDPSIADKHAVIYVKGDKVVVSAKTHESNLCVNNKQVTSAIIGPLDYVGMGPFTLKVKVSRKKVPRPPDKTRPKIVQPLSSKPKVIEKWKTPSHVKTASAPNQEVGGYRVIFKGDLMDGFKPQTVKANLCALLPSDPDTVTSYLNKQRILATHSISMGAAKKYCLALEKAGARCTIETVVSDSNNQTQSVEKIPLAFPTKKEATLEFNSQGTKKELAPLADNTLNSTRVSEPLQHQPMDPDEDDDPEEEEIIRPFLKTVLLGNVYTQDFASGKARVLEIIKFKGNTIVDLQYLAPNKKYIVDKNGKRFCLAKYTSKEVCRLFFNESQTGLIKTPGSPDKPLAELCTHEYLHQKKKRIFSIVITNGQTFHLEEGGYHYHLRLVPKQDSPRGTLVDNTQRAVLQKHLKIERSACVFDGVFEFVSVAT